MGISARTAWVEGKGVGHYSPPSDLPPATVGEEHKEKTAEVEQHRASGVPSHAYSSPGLPSERVFRKELEGRKSGISGLVAPTGLADLTHQFRAETNRERPRKESPVEG